MPAEGYTGDTECKKRDIILIVCREIIRKAICLERKLTGDMSLEFRSREKDFIDHTKLDQEPWTLTYK